MSWLKHAFAVDASGPVEPTEAQGPVVEKVCVAVVRRHLTTPAIAFLEMCRPMNYLGSQAMHFFDPIVSALVDARGYRHFAEFLEHRGAIDYLCTRIEQIELEYEQREKAKPSDPAESQRSADE